MMTARQLPPILIYGESAPLEAAERQLRARSGSQVIQIDPTHPIATEQLSAMGEVVLVYDWDGTDPQVLAAIHTLHPRTLTVGVSSGKNQGLALMGRMYSPEVLARLGAALRALLPEVRHE
ncbi:MAG: hypothetical protein GXP37_15710 [Chloroflexi bacterium]|nr:hypothetical protein [Chloroflexota bacterium]